MILKYLEKLFEFLQPIIASGRTRFLITMSAIVSETYMAKYCSEGQYTELAMYIVGLIAVLFMTLKTWCDYYIAKAQSNKGKDSDGKS